MDIKGYPSGGEAERGVKLSTHHSLMPSSNIYGVISALSLVPSYCAPAYCLVFGDDINI